MQLKKIIIEKNVEINERRDKIHLIIDGDNLQCSLKNIGFDIRGKNNILLSKYYIDWTTMFQNDTTIKFIYET